MSDRVVHIPQIYGVKKTLCGLYLRGPRSTPESRKDDITIAHKYRYTGRPTANCEACILLRFATEAEAAE